MPPSSCTSPWLGGAWQRGLQGHSWAHFPVMAWQASVTKVGLLAPLGLARVAAVKPKAGLEVGEEPVPTKTLAAPLASLASSPPGEPQAEPGLCERPLALGSQENWKEEAV